MGMKSAARPSSANTRKPSDYVRLNLGALSGKTYIYRVFSKKRLFELFGSRENVLVRPTMWEDPFENFILRSPVKAADGQSGVFSFHDDVYGQCWTLLQASDAMWRIYSPCKDGVRIRTTIDKLARSVSAPLGEWAHVQAFIGKVEYLSEAKLKAFAESVFAKNLSAEALARSLLVKRTAFRHEREVRLLYLEKSNTKHAGGLYRCGVDPHDLIDQIMTDPRLPTREADALKAEIETTTGYRGEIKRSLLYAPPKGFVVKIP